MSRKPIALDADHPARKFRNPRLAAVFLPPEPER